jgi:hypothetical protein
MVRQEQETLIQAQFGMFRCQRKGKHGSRRYVIQPGISERTLEDTCRYISHKRMKLPHYRQPKAKGSRNLSLPTDRSSP